MAYQLPNGSTFDFAATYGPAKVVTAISNAKPASVSSVGHGFAVGDIVVVESGWLKLSGRAFRVASQTTDAFVLEGLDTTSVTRYPTGASAGTVRKVLTWVQIAQITEVAFSGGEQQFYTFAFLEESDERQIPTSKSASSMTLTVADDPSQAFVPVVEAADEDGVTRVQRLNLINGDIILYNSITSFSSTPTLNRNELMTRTINLALQGRITRYAA